MAKILVAYATKAGSTAEVAEAVGDELRKSGAEVDVLNVKAVRDLNSYQSVVIGSGARMTRLYRDAVRFARRNRKALQDKTTAYFTVGLAMKKDTPENRKMAAGFLEPLCEVKEPVSLGLFAGVINYSKLEFPFRWIFTMAASKQQEGEVNEMEEGDFRDWDAIRQWAKEISGPLGTSG